MSSSFRRAAALLVALAAFALLAARAVESVVPVGASLSVAKKFWPRAARRASSTRASSGATRSSVRRSSRATASCRSTPTSSSRSRRALPDGAAEEMRRKAAFVLAPRRVTLARGETGRDGFALAPAPR